MTWHRYPLNTYCTEAKPLDAGAMIRIARGNLRHLAGQSPVGCAAWVANGMRSTGSTTYDDASVLWRGHMRMVRGTLGDVRRSIRCRAELYMDAGTATVRLVAVPTWRMPDVADTQNEVESAAAAVTSTAASTPTEVTLAIPRLTVPSGRSAVYGSGGDQRGVARYDYVYLALQAKVNAGPNICTLRNFTIEEIAPS